MAEAPKSLQANANDVDMVAFAREATIRDQASTYAGSVKLVAPAKVNLHLAIGEKMEGGYHKALNIMHALMLHDVLYMRVRPQSDYLVGPDAGLAGDAEHAMDNQALQVRVISVGCEGVEAPVIAQEDNLVYKAVMALGQRTGNGTGQCVEIRLEKHIPFQAGLGGGSSDAAAALVGAAKLWGIPADDPELEQIAMTLGADVAFFLRGGCARYDNKGERFQASLGTARDSIVLVKPQAGLSTAKVYQEFDQNPSLPTEEQVAAAAAAQRAQDVPQFNGLDVPARALLPELDEVFSWAEQQEGVSRAVLCGSGSCVALFVDGFEAACRLSAAAMSQGWWARSTSLANLRAAAVPR